MPKRILLKISGELFKSEETALDLNKVLEVGQEIAKINKDNQVGVIFGGGNIFRGREVKNLNLNMTIAHYTGMTATLVNALAIKNILDSLEVENRIISSLSYSEVIGTNTVLDIDKYFKNNEVLIFTGGSGNSFVTNDTAAVIRALEMRAEVMLKATNVKGVYDKDPQEDNTAQQFKNLSYQDYLKIPKAVILDKVAAVLAEENKLPIYVFKWQSGALKRAIKLKAGGTLIK